MIFVFYCLLLLYPLLFSALSAFPAAFKAKKFFALYSLLTLAFFAGLAGLYYYSKKKNIQVKHSYLCVALLLLALILRLLVVSSLGCHVLPASDFGMAYQTALGAAEHIDYYRIFPSWGFYALVLRAVFAIFPAHFTTVQYLNVALSAASTLLLYCLTFRISKSKWISALAAAFYALYPPSVLYTLYLTPEFFSILLSLLVFLLLDRALKNHGPRWQPLLLSAAAGILLGIADYFKPVSIIVLIAFAAVCLLTWLQKIDWKQLGALALALLVLCSGWFLSKTLTHAAVEQGLDITASKNSSPHFLYIGLSPEMRGHYRDAVYPDLVQENDYDFEKAGDLLMNRLKSEIAQAGAGDMLSLFGEKALFAWSDDLQPLQDIDKYDDNTLNLESSSLYTQAFGLNQFFYWLLMTLCVVGCIALLLFHRENKSLLLINLYIFGFALLLLLSEVQSRYKAIVIPFLCILAAYGLHFILQKAALLITRIKK